MKWDHDDASGRHKIFPSDSDLFDCTDAVLFDTENDHGLSLFEDSDSCFEGGFCTSDQVDYFSPEMDLSGSQATHQEPHFEKVGHIPFFTQSQRRASKKTLRNVNLEDFDEGAQRWAAATLISAIKQFFESIENEKASEEIPKWIFARSTEPTSFDNCCIVNEARPDVLRMRIHYELWRKGLRAAKPLPITEQNLPQDIEQRAFFLTGMAGVTVVGILWQRPGIENSELMKILDDRQRNALSALADQYIISPIESAPYRWYATGINPILQEMDLADKSGSVTYRIERRRKLNITWASRFGDM